MTEADRFLARIHAGGIEPEEGAPPPERILSGRPTTRTWTLEEAAGGLYAGLWEGTPGEWRVEYEEWEFFHVVEGVSVLTPEGGAPVRLGPGDAFVVRPGFRGTWRVEERTLKHFVVRL